MSNLTKGLILVAAILVVGLGLTVWKKTIAGHSTEMFDGISKEEIELLLANAAKTNPQILQRFTQEPELKKQQLDSFRQLFAFASQAKKEGMADTGTNRQELLSIKAEIEAVSYDREINKDKGPMPPFGFITEDQIRQYWEEGAPADAPKGFFATLKEKLGGGSPDRETRSHEDEFNDFLNAKIDMLKKGNPDMADRVISDDEKSQAKDLFAKIRIYRNEFETKAAAGELDKNFVATTALQVKLQQAQFLARQYSETLEDKLKVSDDEVQSYIDAHPELNPSEKKAKAQSILDRAKAGEDFAELANEFSEDPGNKGPDGKGQGGLYKDVQKGRMVAPFEAAALALQEGQIAPDLVETDFGYHIVKLERKLSVDPSSKDKNESYDVRHILISTGYKDPSDPTGREMPVKQYVLGKLEGEKQEKLIDDIVASNGVHVPDDFTVPELTQEELDQIRKQQQQPQQMPQNAPGGPDQKDKPAAKPAANAKPEVKKPEAPKKK